MLHKTHRHAESPGDGAGITPVDNYLLRALPGEDLARLHAVLEPVQMTGGDSIYEANEQIEHAYFPVSGVISMVSAMERGTVEVGTVGREGMAGLPLLLHTDRMPTRAFVQVPGAAFRLTARALRDALDEHGALETLLFRYAQVLFDQVAQGAACNRMHTIEERCARWILMTQDRVGDAVLPLKQQFLAEMLGAYRPAVTLAAGALQHAGLIAYVRGRITVLDRAGLEAAACPCYEITRRGFERLRVA
jgi:CRP-like cAMP-binding protein